MVGVKLLEQCKQLVWALLCSAAVSMSSGKKLANLLFRISFVQFSGVWFTTEAPGQKERAEEEQNVD